MNDYCYYYGLQSIRGTFRGFHVEVGSGCEAIITWAIAGELIDCRVYGLGFRVKCLGGLGFRV